MKKKNDLKNACHHRQESQSLFSSCVTHNEETSLIICKLKHAQIWAICNKFRPKLQQLQECLVDRALSREGKQIQNLKMQYSKSVFYAMP